MHAWLKRWIRTIFVFFCECLDTHTQCNYKMLYKAKKNKLYVSKLPRAFVFRCAFDSAKFKVLILFACLIFFQFFMNLLVIIYMKRHERHNITLCTTDFLISVFCLVSCSSINQVPYFILNKVVTYPNLTCLLLRKKNKQTKKQKQNKTKKQTFKKKTHLGQVFQSVTSFET